MALQALVQTLFSVSGRAVTVFVVVAESVSVAVAVGLACMLVVLFPVIGRVEAGLEGVGLSRVVGGARPSGAASFYARAPAIAHAVTVTLGFSERRLIFVV